jgi:hypothetical protein
MVNLLGTYFFICRKQNIRGPCRDVLSVMPKLLIR